MSLVSLLGVWSLVNLSSVSVVFDFNASLNDDTPISPISLPDDVMKKGKSELLMVFSVCLPLSPPSRYSSVSVVFDFNATLNDVAPVSPISFTVRMKQKEKCVLMMDIFFDIFLFSRFI